MLETRGKLGLLQSKHYYDNDCEIVFLKQYNASIKQIIQLKDKLNRLSFFIFNYVKI